MSSQMERSWLVQRLDTPIQFKVAGMVVDNPFAFGGGYKNGGLTDEAMGLLRNIFTFDYMGAAEFEWGAVPKALQIIAKQADRNVLVIHSFTIDTKDVAPHWREPKGHKPTGTHDIYVLCELDWVQEVEDRIRGWAKDGYQSRLKETTNLSSVLRPDPREDGYVPDTKGWLELDNGFMFFTDRTMWQKTAELFGLTVPATEEATTP